MTNTFFDLNILRLYVKSLVVYEDVSTRNTRKIMKDSSFRRVLVRDGIRRTNDCGTIDTKHIIEVLQKQIKFCRKYDIMFRPERQNALPKAVSPSMAKEYVGTIDKAVRREVMGSRGSGNLRIANIDGNAE